MESSSSLSRIGDLPLNPGLTPVKKKGKVKKVGKKKKTKAEALVASMPKPSSDAATPPLSSATGASERVRALPPAPKGIEGQAQLFQVSRAIQATAEKTPLVPSNKNSLDLNDVYINGEAVFKPGREAAAKSTACYGLLLLNGLGDAVPPAKGIVMPQLVARRDDGIKYVKMKTPGGEEVIADPDEQYRIPKGVKPDKEGQYVVKIEGVDFRFIPTEKRGIYEVEEATDSSKDGVSDLEGSDSDTEESGGASRREVEFHDHLEDEFVIRTDPDNSKIRYFVPKDSQSKVQSDDEGEYVIRGKQRYRLVEDAEGNIQVVGKKIPGMVQVKVEKLYLGPVVSGRQQKFQVNSDSIHSKPFFDRIDTDSFTDAFLATVVLRPRDGKIGELSESNFLFQALPNEDGVVDPQDPTCMLRPVLIDLDEALRPEIDIRSEKSEKDIHPIRNGLMGFPQAEQVLTGGHKLHAVGVIKKLIENQKASAEYLNGLAAKDKDETISKKHAESHAKVVGRLEKFLADRTDEDGVVKDFSMQDVFFHVFPKYKAQWKAMEKLGVKSRSAKAQEIGFQSLKDITKTYKRRQQTLD